MRTAWPVCLVVLGAASAAAAPREARPLAAVQDAELRPLDVWVAQLVRGGALERRAAEADEVLPGRVHERFTQVHAGVRVFGGEIVRQSDSAGVVSIFGTFYEGIGALGVQPAIGADEAAARVSALAGQPAWRTPELYVFPRRHADGYALAWRVVAASGRGRHAYFVDASSGALIHRINDLPSQAPGGSAVGLGRGVLDDAKKMSVATVGGTFRAEDRLRPAPVVTLDLKGNLARASAFVDGLIPLTIADIATDSDNDWRDGAVVDAHNYTGWTYDYYFKRHGRRSYDNANGALVNVVHPARLEDAHRQPNDVISTFYYQAIWLGNGIMLFGEGLPNDVLVSGQRVNYLAGALDAAAHELTHGVTEHSSNLIYEAEAGALNEAFSDMMGTSVEFFFQEPGSGSQRADYLIGEDVVTPGGIRSMANPIAYGDPDHYSLRVQLDGPCTDETDACGVHSNSGIPNHAFYLAIEGGRNRVSGLTVQGVGAANREQVERVFYRAFTQMLPRGASFSLARAATVQSARDLYGAGSAAERAVTQAWAAVGVP